MQFYKVKNGNSSFEYEISFRLDRIEKIISKKNFDLLCGVFSGIIAFYIQDEYGGCGGWAFIGILIGIYVGLKIAIVLFQYLWGRYFYKRLVDIKNDIFDIEDTESDKVDIETKAFFWNKIVNAVIQGISLVNRLDNIQNEGDTKLDLIPIYAMQAEYIFESVSEMLRHTDILRKGDKGKGCIDAIGSDAVIWVFSESQKCLEKLKYKISIINGCTEDTVALLHGTEEFYNINLKNVRSVAEELSKESVSKSVKSNR